MTQGFITLENVTKSFGAKHVLNGVSLSVDKGESLVVIGGSGTGKSVMLKCILGILKPDSGEILVDGHDVTKFSGRERERMMKEFGMLFQGGALFDSMKVWENVAFSLTHNYHYSAKKAKNAAIENLAAVGLNADVADLSPAELSGGMQKRVALCRCRAR